jgi:membrane-associated phospholipid phosphatase
VRAILAKRSSIVLLFAFVLAPATAAAEDRGASLPDASYLWDGGAIPFIWGALGARLALDHYATPRSSPLMFSPAEGGAASPAWQVPGWTVSVGAGVLAGTLVIGGDDSRWYHAKGVAESLVTGSAITAALKLTFGRHRPDWAPSTDLDEDRRSFPSGHSTQAFAIATYATAYLRRHVFNAYRDGDRFPAYEIATYVLLYGGATGVAAERVFHHQHHVTDVLAGAALGTTTSLLFFRYQERRYRTGKHGEIMPYVTPMASAKGASVSFGWQW